MFSLKFSSSISFFPSSVPSLQLCFPCRRVPHFSKCNMITSYVPDGLLATDWFWYPIWPLQIWIQLPIYECPCIYTYICTHTACPPTSTQCKTSHCIIVVSHFGDRKWEIDFAYPGARINTEGKLHLTSAFLAWSATERLIRKYWGCVWKEGPRGKPRNCCFVWRRKVLIFLWWL